LPEEERQQIQDLLFILEKFNVSESEVLGYKAIGLYKSKRSFSLPFKFFYFP
jgi:hypothetical protein